MQKKPFILLSNDDGIDAPGLKALWETLQQSNLFELAVIAPNGDRSGTGVSITWDHPILVKKIEWPNCDSIWVIGGTPADCIKMGLSVILKKTPDLVLSGINAGSNAGRNILHSGTIGAVIEAVLRGIPGIAFSCEDGQEPHYELTQKYLLALVQYLLKNPLPSGSFYNVNFPRKIKSSFKGFVMTRHGKGRWVEEPKVHMETEHGPSYWLGGKPEEQVEDPDCDISLLHEGYATVVPVSIMDHTDLLTLKAQKERFEKIMKT